MLRSNKVVTGSHGEVGATLKGRRLDCTHQHIRHGAACFGTKIHEETDEQNGEKELPIVAWKSTLRKGFSEITLGADGVVHIRSCDGAQRKNDRQTDRG